MVVQRAEAALARVLERADATDTTLTDAAAAAACCA
jgi:hypothetical protein